MTVPKQGEETENVLWSAFRTGLQDLLYELLEENHSILSIGNNVTPPRESQ